MPRPTHLVLAALLGVTTLNFALPALAQSACAEAERKMVEAGALRYQAREEARAGDRGRVCETLDEAGDRYDDAKDLFDDCGRTVTAIELRGATRNLDGLKRMNGCL